MRGKHRVVIEARSRWYETGLSSLWTDRELLGFLVSRDIRVRYKQTSLGVFWAVLQPLLMTVIFTAVFSANVPAERLSVPYPLFALSGLVLWFFISSSINRAAWSLVTNRNLVTKIYVPRLLIVFSSVLSGLIEFGISFLLLGGLMTVYAIPVTWQIFFVPYFLIMSIVLSLAIGIFFAGITVRFRDVEFILPFLLQLWMFSSPVFYPIGMLADRWQVIERVNPLAGLVDGFRSAMFGLPFDVEKIAISSITAVTLFILSLVLFGRLEKDFADII